MLDSIKKTKGVGGENHKADTHRNIFLLAEEAHSDVVPERGAFGNSTSRHPVLREGHIEVPVHLHHATGRQNCLGNKAGVAG